MSSIFNPALAESLLNAGVNTEAKANNVDNLLQVATLEQKMTEDSRFNDAVKILEIAQNQNAVSLGTEINVRSDRSIKVTNSKSYSRISMNNPYMDMSVKPRGGKLIGVFVTVKNTGRQSGNLFWSTFQLTDNQGRIYDSIQDIEDMVVINMWANEQGYDDLLSQLFPGGTADVVIVFRVAPDAENLRLIANNKCCFAIK